jgi:cell division protein FtsA
MFELLDQRLSRASAAGRPLPRRVVLTGGGSLLPGVRELAEDVFRAPVRLALPANVKGLGETYSTPAFAAVSGLLRWELSGAPDAMRAGVDRANGETGAGLFRSVGHWLKENF